MTKADKAQAGMSVLKQTAADFSDDDCMSSAAAIAYYSIFSLPPLLVLIIMMTGWLGQESQVTSQIAEQVDQVAGDGSYEEIAKMSAQTRKQGSNVLASVIGFIVLIFSATGVMAQLQFALNKAWEVQPDPEQGGIKNFLMKRLLSFGMILTLAFLLLVSTVLTLILSAAGGMISNLLSLPDVVMYVVPLVVNLLVITLLFAAMFKVLPDASVRWKDVLMGALFTAILFILGKYLIGFYLSWANVESSYGQAGKLVAVLVWFYYSSLIILFGAEFTQAWAQRFGRAIRPSSGAVRVVQEKTQVRDEPDRPATGRPESART